MNSIFADATRGLSWGVSIAVMWTAFAIGVAIGDAFTAYDETDSAATSTRSGLDIRTDYGTGCQYLDGGFALTPRLSGSGRQICTKEGRDAR